MGGGGGGKKQSAPAPQHPQVIYMPAPQQQADNSMALMMEMMKQQQAAAAAAAAESARAAREATISAENRYSGERQLQSVQGASDTLARMSEMQKLSDAAALDKAQKENLAAGMAATGGGYDINAARNAALANLGAASTTLPSTAANLAANPSLVNPALTTAASQNTGTGGTTQRTNVFTLPSASQLTFGGA